MSLLSNFIGQVESGNNPNASLTDYAGNVSVNAQYQQSAAYIQNYGGVGGAPAIDNQAAGLLQANPNATLGDFYSAYNHGSVLNWGSYSSRYPLQANNFLTNANAQGYDQNTPLSSLTGGTSGNSVTFGANPPTSQLQQAADAGVGSDTPDLTDADFNGLSDSDIVGASDAAGSGVGSIDASTLASSLGSGAGTPVNITDLPGLDTSLTGASKTVGTDTQQAAGGIAGTAASILNSAEQYTSRAFVVIALVLLGALFIAFGLGMFGKRELAAVT